MGKSLNRIFKFAKPGCEYTGGGIWLSYMPIVAYEEKEDGTIDAEGITLCYSSEEYYHDDDTPEFFVMDESMDAWKREYGENGCFVDIPKTSHLYPIYLDLRDAVEKGIVDGVPFDWQPIMKSL